MLLQKLRLQSTSNKQLVEICKDFGISLVDSGGDAHLIHEILETSLNLHLSEEEWLNPLDRKNKYEILARLEDLTSKLPTQSWRGLEQTTLQQFSTPPALAYHLLLMLRPEAGKLALEPSAGTGSLAVWLRRAGCPTEVNEISARRKLLLKLQNYAPFAVNAEFLDDLLPAQIKPDFILMNPPFSASGGRAGDSNFGFRHVEAALLRLQPGGRLVALLGADACLETDKGKKFRHLYPSGIPSSRLLDCPARSFLQIRHDFSNRRRNSQQTRNYQSTESAQTTDCRIKQFERNAALCGRFRREQILKN